MNNSSNRGGRNVLYGREFIKIFADKADLEYDEARKLTELFFRTISAAMCEDTSVCFRNFGVFGIRPISRRLARNPRTMEEYWVSEGYKPEFKASKQLREAVDKSIKEKEAALSLQPDKSAK